MSEPNRLGWVRYGAPIALGAFLLFQVQPLIAAYILPWFGGSPAVWTTCLLFFQSLLVGGYAYAHFLAVRVPPRAQGILHLALLAATLLTLPIIPADTWKPGGDESPILAILALLTLTLGAPYLLLSATGPLLQSWFDRAWPTTSPYRLYAVSNAASLLGLILFPLLVQPLMQRAHQGVAWSVMYGAFVAAVAWPAIVLVRTPKPPAAAAAAAATTKPHPLSRWIVARWLLLALLGSAVLLSVTNKMTQDVAPVPFLWVIPLALYLITFVVAFDRPRWYDRRVFVPAIFVSALPFTIYWKLLHPGNLPFLVHVVGLSVLLFAACMVCHGELVRLKPEQRSLTSFYLAMSIGGALGGVAIAVVAPLVFKTVAEFSIAVVGTTITFFYLVYRETGHPLFHGKRPILIFAAAWFIAIGLGAQPVSRYLGEDYLERNFYGTLRIADSELDSGGKVRRMHHNKTLHGLQFRDPDKELEPTTYYGRASGAAIAIDILAERVEGPLRVGAIGLGVGTIATYGRTDDVYRFYEIDKDVVRLAQERFTFLRKTRATVEVVIADGRLGLERDRREQLPFHVLVVDAFSGGAVPTHLLTTECFELYAEMLAPGGIIALHTSNNFLDLAPVVRGAADHLGYAVEVLEFKDPGPGEQISYWIVVAGEPGTLDDARFTEARITSDDTRTVVWTDSHSSLLRVIKH